MESKDTHSHPIHLRQATLADVPTILEMEKLSFAHAGERFAEKRVRYLITSRRTIVTVAESHKRLLGWVAGHAWPKGATPWGRVYALAVHPDARGRRLGPMLLQSMLDDLRARGAGRYVLEVRPDNTAAVRLYEKFGFEVCQTLNNYYGEGRPAQRMKKTMDCP